MRYRKARAYLYFIASRFFCLASVLAGFSQRPLDSVITGGMAVALAAASSVLFQKDGGSSGDRPES